MKETISVPMEFSVPEWKVYTFVDKETALKILKALDKVSGEIQKQLIEQS